MKPGAELLCQVTAGLGSAATLLLGLSSLLCFDRAWEAYQVVTQALRALSPGAPAACSLCGMSRAFRAIWLGRFEAASQLNAGAIPLFSLLLFLLALGGGAALALALAARLNRHDTAAHGAKG